jgi:hypothetical protein
MIVSAIHGPYHGEFSTLLDSIKCAAEVERFSREIVSSWM